MIARNAVWTQVLRLQKSTHGQILAVVTIFGNSAGTRNGERMLFKNVGVDILSKFGIHRYDWI